MIHHLPSPLILSVLVFAFSTQASSNPAASWQCYNPDGTAANHPDYMPCIDVSGIDSMCCALNRTSSNVDTCAQNGLCISGGTYYRDYCTDPTWKSPNCLPRGTCAEESNATQNNTVAMTQCVDGTWCCGSNNNTCCGKNQGFTIQAKLPIFQAASDTINSTTNPSTSTNPSSTTFVTVTATATPSASDTSKVGIAVGVALGVLAIAGSMVGFWLGQKRGLKRGEQKMVDGGYAMRYGGTSPDAKVPMLGGPAAAAGYPPVYGGAHVVQEIDTESRVAELGTGR